MGTEPGATEIEKEKPRPRKSQETRDRIIRAAVKAFSESGFEGASTRQIAALAGENQGLITYHFSTKENLWKAAIDSVFVPLAADLADRAHVLADADIRTRLRLIIIFLVRQAAERPEQMRLMVQEGREDSPRIKWLVERHIEAQYEYACTLFRDAIDDGLMPPAPYIHYFYIIVGAASLFFTARTECKHLTGIDTTDPATIEAHAETLVNLFLS